MLSKLREIRKKHGYTQKTIALEIGISPQLFSCLERGEIRLTYERAITIANIFGVTPDEIFLTNKSNEIGLATGTEG